MGVAPVVRRPDIAHLRQRQPEGTDIGLAVEAARGDGRAVIGHGAGDEGASRRLAGAPGHHPEHLDDGVVGLRARIDEVDPGDLHRRDLDQLLGERDRRHCGAAEEGVVGRHLRHRFMGRLHQPGLAEAGDHVPETRHALQIALAMGVVDIDTFAPLQHERAVALQGGEMGVGMKMMREIARFGGVQRHRSGPRTVPWVAAGPAGARMLAREAGRSCRR